MTHRSLIAPVAGTGVLICAYLATRPYGDSDGATTSAAAQAFASNWWVFAHLCGALGLASYGWMALRLADQIPGRLSTAARWSGLAGVVAVLPYYGAETFALHVLGRAALAGDPQLLSLVAEIRDQPAALVMFGVGLVLLAVCAVLVALRWQRATGSRAAWPLSVLVVCFLPQFYLPPVGRVGYGIAYALAAALMARSAWRES